MQKEISTLLPSLHETVIINVPVIDGHLTPLPQSWYAFQPFSQLVSLPSDPDTHLIVSIHETRTILQVRLVSTTEPAIHPPYIQFSFPHAILPGSSMVECTPTDTSFVLIVLLANGVIYRLSFDALDDLFHHDYTSDWCTTFASRLAVSESRVPTCMAFIGRNNVIVTCNDGALIEVTLPNRAYGLQDSEEDFEEVEMSAPDFFSQVRTFLTPGRLIHSSLKRLTTTKREQVVRTMVTHGKEQPVDVVTYTLRGQVDTFILFVTRERKLSIWSSLRKTCLRTIQLVENDVLLSAHPGVYMRVVPTVLGDEDDDEEEGPQVVHVVVYCPLQDDDAVFAVYRLVVEPGGFLKSIDLVHQRPCTDAFDGNEADYELVDFMLEAVECKNTMDVVRLWSVWNTGEGQVVKYTYLTLPTQPMEGVEDAFACTDYAYRWLHVIPERLMDVMTRMEHVEREAEARSMDLLSAFIEYMLHPSHFTPDVVENACMLYDTTQQQDDDPFSTLDNERADLSDMDLRLRIAALVTRDLLVERSEYDGKLLEEEYVLQLKGECIKLLGTCCQLLEEGHRSHALGLLMEGVVLLKRDRIATFRPCDVVEHLVYAHAVDLDEGMLAKTLPTPLTRSGDAMDMLALLEASAVLQPVLSALEWRSFEEEVLDTCKSPKYASIQDIAVSLYDRMPKDDPNLAAIVSDAFHQLESIEDVRKTLEQWLYCLSSSYDSAESSTLLHLKGTSFQWTAGAIVQMVHVRYGVARDMCFLLILLTALSNGSMGKRRILPASHVLLNRFMDMVHALGSLRWLLAQPFDQLEDLGRSAWKHLDTIEDHPTPLFTAIPMLTGLADSDPMDITQQAHAFLKRAIYTNGQDITESMIVFGTLLSGQGWFKVLDGYLQWHTPSQASYYLKGTTLLGLAQPDEAFTYFVRDGFQTESNLHLVIKPQQASTNNPLCDYYVTVAQLFEKHGHYSHALSLFKMAMDALKSTESTQDATLVAQLCSSVFRCCIEDGEYDDAFHAILANPDNHQQEVCLRHFISVLCSNNEIAKLCNYAFARLETQVERTLEFKARNSDPMLLPNYYKILYAYQAFRGDYRSAAKAMLLYSYRLDQTPLLGTQYAVVANEKASSLLAAIHALHLVDEENRWAVIPLADAYNDDQARCLLMW